MAVLIEVATVAAGGLDESGMQVLGIPVEGDGSALVGVIRVDVVLPAGLVGVIVLPSYEMTLVNDGDPGEGEPAAGQEQEPKERKQMSGPGRPGRLPAVRGRAVALRVEPSGYRRLAPAGFHRGRNSVRPAVPAFMRCGPFPCPGSAGFMSVMLRMTDARLAIAPALRSLHCAPLGVRSSRTPPRSPPRP